MKYFLTYFLIFSGFVQATLTEPNEVIKFHVKQHDYRFSTIFEMTSSKGFVGSAKKSSISIRTNYELYDKKGKYEGVGISRLLCLGALKAWGTEIDVYSATDERIGYIDGQVATAAAAKFSIYNQENLRVGIAYLELGNSSFIILDPENELHHLATLTRNFIADTIDNWDVIIYEPEAIDLRIIKVFASFAVDSQEHFKIDL